MLDDDWWTKAECIGSPDRIWWTSGPGKKALAYCARCQVVEPCLEEALRAEALNGKGDTYGVRGGKTSSQRKRIIQQMRRDINKP